jgi:hypothetical protein
MKRALLLLAAVLLLLPASCRAPVSAANPEEPAIRQFLERYFSTWSAQDMDGYAACFHESARVTFLTDPASPPRTDTLSDFLHGQRLSHKTASEPMRETADSFEIRADHRAALARVRWTLVKGAERSTGIDHFSLIKTDSGWKIIHLLFYAD